MDNHLQTKTCSAPTASITELALCFYECLTTEVTFMQAMAGLVLQCALRVFAVPLVAKSTAMEK